MCQIIDPKLSLELKTVVEVFENSISHAFPLSDFANEGQWECR